MTEVKVGQVYRHSITGSEYTVVEPSPFTVLVNKTGLKYEMHYPAIGDGYELVKDVASPPSDLEIVQKALGDNYRLRMSGYDWFVLSAEAIIASGKDHSSLILWAKTTIGVE